MPFRRTAQPEPIPAGIPDHVDPRAEYRVQLGSPVELGAVTLSVAEVHVMSGETVLAYKDSVHGAVLIPDKGVSG